MRHTPTSKSVFVAFLFTILLAACSQAAAPTATQAPTETLAPTKTTAPSPTPNVYQELGMPHEMTAAFEGSNSTFIREADGSFSVDATSYQSGTREVRKYSVEVGSFDIHPEISNAYAPATIHGADADGNQVTLIWNQETVWTEEFSLSTDVASPTDFAYEDRIPMLQSILLQHDDPFAERSQGLLIHSERTENGRVVYLRTG
jgi:hypothetical protein